MKTSDDPFVAPGQREIPDHETDPYNVLCTVEQQMIDDFNINLKGITVNTATNPVLTATAAAALVHTRYTDLLDVIQDKVRDERLLSRVLPSMAWMIDNTIITNARIWFFQEFKESDKVGEEQGLEDFMRSFAGSIQVEESFGGGGPATTLIQLIGLRQQWHDAAGSAMDAAGRVYEPKSFDALIRDEKVQQQKPEARARQAMMIKAMLEMEGHTADDKFEKEILESMAQRNANRAKARLELNKKIGPVVEQIIEIATRHSDAGVRFEHLDKIVRERLFKTSKKFVQNATMDLAEWNLTDSEYVDILMQYKSFSTAVDLVLATQYKDDPVAQSIKGKAEAATKRHAAKSDSADYEADLTAAAAANATAP